MELNSAELKALEKTLNDAEARQAEERRKFEDKVLQALAESRKLGQTIEAATNAALKEMGEKALKTHEEVLTVRAQSVELAQKIATVPQGKHTPTTETAFAEVFNSQQWKNAADAGRMAPVSISAIYKYFNTQITNPNPLSNDNPLVPAERLGGVIVPPEQRLYMRDIIPVARTDRNLVEFATEATFTSNARPQGDASPVGHGEGELKAESAMTFTLTSIPIITLAHGIPASRQVLSDAQFLQGHIGSRLLYGLKKKEDDMILNGVSAAGEIDGLIDNATAYSHGVTNDTILDTLLKSQLQLNVANFEATGYVMNPVQWYDVVKLKDTQNRYLFADPHNMEALRVWGKPVVHTTHMPTGRFLAGDFIQAAQIWDREDATVRISDQHSDFFMRNLVMVLAENRMGLAIYRGSAMIYGSTSHQG